MFNKLKALLVHAMLLGAVSAVVFTAGFLQELSTDELPDRIKEVGIPRGKEHFRIEISIQRMSLSLFDGDTLVKRYDMGYGKGPPGQLAGKNGATPLGEYRIVAKEKRKGMYEHGSRFLLIDFPNEEDTDRAYWAGTITADDRDRIERARISGDRLPTDTPFGGPFGIQGNYWFFRTRRFTDGNVALSNGDINEIFEHVKVGTRVTIQME